MGWIGFACRRGYSTPPSRGKAKRKPESRLALVSISHRSGVVWCGAGERREMDAFVARHPVFDRYQAVFGYELEFRSGVDAYYEALSAGAEGVDFVRVADVGELAAGKRGFIQFTPNLLADDAHVAVPRETAIVTMPCALAVDDHRVHRAGLRRRLAGIRSHQPRQGRARCAYDHGGPGPVQRVRPL